MSLFLRDSPSVALHRFAVRMVPLWLLAYPQQVLRCWSRCPVQCFLEWLDCSQTPVLSTLPPARRARAGA